MKTIATPIEDQVPNLETCKKLKEVWGTFGVKLDTLLYHFSLIRKTTNITNHRIDDIFEYDTYTLDKTVEVTKPTPAPLFTELWRFLPDSIDDFKLRIRRGVRSITNGAELGYISYIHPKGEDMGMSLAFEIYSENKSISQATAELLIWVAENHPEQLKQHLEGL